MSNAAMGWGWARHIDRTVGAAVAGLVWSSAVGCAAAGPAASSQRFVRTDAALEHPGATRRVASRPVRLPPVDPALRRLVAQLSAELARVHEQLLVLQPGKEPEAWQRLVDRRLRLSVALLRVERALRLGVPLVLLERLEPRAMVLRVPERRAAERRIRAVEGSPSIAELLEDADQRLTEARARANARAHGDKKRKAAEERWGLEKMAGAEPEVPPAEGWLPTGAPAAVATSEQPASPPAKSAAREERERIEASVVRPGVVPDSVVPAVEQHLGSLLACFPSELRRADRIGLRVRALLADDGTLRQATVESDVDLPPLVAGCVSDVLARVRVPPPEGGARVVSFPLWLTSP